MQLPRPVVLAVLLPFALYSTYVLIEVGYLGLLKSHMHLAGYQVFADLVIVCSLAMVWMWRDAATNDRNVWPYLVVTLVLGSIGPMLYLLLARQPHAAETRAYG